MHTRRLGRILTRVRPSRCRSCPCYRHQGRQAATAIPRSCSSLAGMASKIMTMDIAPGRVQSQRLCRTGPVRAVRAVQQTAALSTAKLNSAATIKKSSMQKISRAARQLPRARHAVHAVALSSSSTESQGYSYTPVFVATAICSLGAMLFGLHVGVINGPLDAIAADLGFAANAQLKGAVVSSALLGATAGSLSGSGLADSQGRRRAFLMACIPLVLGSILCATASSAATLLAGRLLAGVGIGLSSALVPLYISEIAPTEIRGALGSVNQLVICLGILLALTANIVIPATRWRTLFWLTMGPAVLLFLGMLSRPESPRWLSSKGRQDEAAAIAKSLWGANGPSQLKGSSTDSATGSTATKSVGLGELLGARGVRIGIILFLLQQFSGINAVIYFSTKVFAQAGIQNASLSSAAVGATNVLGTIVAGSVIERAGRKQLLTLSYTGMGIAMLALAAGSSIPSLASSAGTIAFTGILGYIVFFSLGAGAVTGLMVPEVNTEAMRGRAVSLAMAVHWIANFSIGQFFEPTLVAVGQTAIYGFFAAVCVLAVLFARSSYLPETKGKSLEDIQRILAAT